MTGSFEEFILYFGYAALNEHISYLTKAEVLLSGGQANEGVQKARKAYHSHMLATTYHWLKMQGEDIKDLEPWIDILTYL